MWDNSPCPPGHNTPLPLKRSPPASFKRLLGGSLTLQILPKAPHQPDVDKTESPVGGRAYPVVLLRVRSKQNGRAHVCTPVTVKTPIAYSALETQTLKLLH